MGKPRIAVVLDENTSGGATRYEASKTYFQAIADVGGLPFGIPFLSEVVETVIRDFDGVMTAGGRFAYPDDWYLPGQVSKAPPSDRFDIERAIVEGFLNRDKPILGLCAGMQMIACLHGCRLSPDVLTLVANPLNHDERGAMHPVSIEPDTLLARLVGVSTLTVNTLHREAVAELGEAVRACAFAGDGVIEAIEIPGAGFALGLQWHQEAFALSDHPGNAVFRGLVDAC